MNEFRVINVFDQAAYKLNHLKSSQEFKEMMREKDEETFTTPIRYYQIEGNKYFAEQYISSTNEWWEVEFNRMYPNEKNEAYMCASRFECMVFEAILSNEKKYAMNIGNNKSSKRPMRTMGEAGGSKGSMPTTIYLENHIKEIILLNNMKVSPYICSLVRKDLEERGLL